MILRVQCDPCNAPSGLNETINLYDQPPAYRLLTLHSNGAIDTGVHFLTAAESVA